MQPLTGGASSLAFHALVTDGPTPGERVVLKVAPPGLEPVRNRDIEPRQARLMRALAGSPGVRVPTVYFEDNGTPPEVSPFHAMNIVPGECLEPILSQPPADVLPIVPNHAFGGRDHARHAPPCRPRRRRPRCREKRTSLEDEIKRWTAGVRDRRRTHNARYLEAEGLLFATMPAALPDAVCHGDYRLGNMLCDGATVAALIDWEIGGVHADGDVGLDDLLPERVELRQRERAGAVEPGTGAGRMRMMRAPRSTTHSSSSIALSTIGSVMTGVAKMRSSVVEASTARASTGSARG